jgi:hypothetical protein
MSIITERARQRMAAHTLQEQLRAARGDITEAEMSSLEQTLEQRRRSHIEATDARHRQEHGHPIDSETDSI